MIKGLVVVETSKATIVNIRQLHMLTYTRTTQFLEDMVEAIRGRRGGQGESSQETQQTNPLPKRDAGPHVPLSEVNAISLFELFF